MSWLERNFGQAVHQAGVLTDPATEVAEETITDSTEAEMSPGLNGNIDWELREKAGMHKPPTPPEYMGLEGEFDEQGLAKRVALALDRDSNLNQIETVEIEQNGSTIVFKGSVPSESVLHRLAKLASQVDGTKAVDTSQVSIETT